MCSQTDSKATEQNNPNPKTLRAWPSELSLPLDALNPSKINSPVDSAPRTVDVTADIDKPAIKPTRRPIAAPALNSTNPAGFVMETNHPTLSLGSTGFVPECQLPSLPVGLGVEPHV